MKYLALIAVVFLIGCTNAGPYVTNISSNGRGGLVIEKAYARYNGITGTISTDDVTTSTIQVVPE